MNPCPVGRYRILPARWEVLLNRNAKGKRPGKLYREENDNKTNGNPSPRRNAPSEACAYRNVSNTNLGAVLGGPGLGLDFHAYPFAVRLL
jgi:hypothetical protein